MTIAVKGDFGKPRPALVVQNDALGKTPNVLVCPLTSSEASVHHLRYALLPGPQNGLRVESTIMLTNIIAVPRAKCGGVIGSLASEQMADIDQMLAFIVGLSG